MSLFINAIIYGLQFILRIPASLLALCGSRQNEYDADAFAVKLGFGSGTLSCPAGFEQRSHRQHDPLPAPPEHPPGHQRPFEENCGNNEWTETGLRIE